MIFTLDELTAAKKLFFIPKLFITEGYRANENFTFCKCSKTLFMVHNETANIWSHLLPGFYFCVELILCATKQSVYREMQHWESRVGSALGSLSIMFCMFASTSYHLYMPMSSDWNNRLLKLELIGIGIMIFGLTLIAIYLSFHNWPQERLYTICGMAGLCLFHFVLQMTPCYTNPFYDKHRVVLYCGILALCFGLALYGRFYIATEIEISDFFPKLLLSYLWLTLGFIFYATSFPERFYRPKWVQLAIPSHFWWHVFVFMNGYTLYWTGIEFSLHVEEFWVQGSEPGSPNYKGN